MRKRITGLLVCVGLLLGLLSGCSSDIDADTSTVSVNKKGAITSLIVESFEKDYYSQEELENFLNSELADYEVGHVDSSIKLKDVSFSDDMIKVTMQFADDEEYASFNGITFFNGDVLEAQAAGYDFSVDFYEVTSDTETEDEDGNSTEGAGSTKAGTAYKKVSSNDFISDTDCKVIITQERINVKVAGKILYVSDELAQLYGSDTVGFDSSNSISDGMEQPIVYIIYK